MLWHTDQYPLLLVVQEDSSVGTGHKVVTHLHVRDTWFSSWFGQLQIKLLLISTYRFCMKMSFHFS